jgi:hypothetical protein
LQQVQLWLLRLLLQLRLVAGLQLLHVLVLNGRV